jgi:hemerythrin superfamily protein
MNATQLILADHRELERLFKDLERAARADDPARRAELVRELVRALSVHAVVEEQFVYPVLREAGAGAAVLEALEEHHAVKLTLAELERLPPTSGRHAAKVGFLAESVRRHLAEEEKELLPRLERTLGDDGHRALGEALERAKRAAPTRPHPSAPDTPPGNLVTGAFAALYDRSRDALRGGGQVLRTIGEQGASWSADAARRLASRARRRSREAAEQGRAAVEAGLEQGRDAVEEAREATARVEVRASEAASTAERRGRSAARPAKARGRTAGRGRRARAPRR